MSNRIDGDTEFERWLDIWRMQHPADDEKILAAAAHVHDCMRLALASRRTLFPGLQEDRPETAMVTVAVYEAMEAFRRAEKGTG